MQAVVKLIVMIFKGKTFKPCTNQTLIKMHNGLTFHFLLTKSFSYFLPFNLTSFHA